MDMQHLKELLKKKKIGRSASIYEIDACINQFRHCLPKVIKVAGKHILNNFSGIAVLDEMCDC